MIDNLVTHEILPMRTAAEQFELVGAKSALLTYNVGLGLYYISSGLGACVMVKKEWNEYLRLCGLWTALPLDLEGAPGISMLEATADEEAELDALRLRQPSGFARSFREIEECLLAHARCLSDEERDEIIRQIGSKVLPLKEAVLRAEEIWIEGDCNERDELIKAVREIETLRRTVKRQEMSLSALIDAGDSLGLSCRATDEHGLVSVQVWAGTKAAVARVMASDTKGGPDAA